MAVGVPSPYGHLIIPTPQVTTGNVFNVQDVVANNYAPPIPPGAIWFTKDSGGNTAEYQYVQFRSSANGNNLCPGSPLFYRDYTRTIVSDTLADAASYVASTSAGAASFAGVFLLNIGSIVTGNMNSAANDTYIVIQKNGVISIGNNSSGNGNAMAGGAGIAVGQPGFLGAGNANAGLVDQWSTASNNNGMNACFPDNCIGMIRGITASTGTVAGQAFLIGPVI